MVETIFVGQGSVKEIPQSGPREVLLILGQGVKPELSHGGGEQGRHVVMGSAYDSQILRVKTTAAGMLVAHGRIDGPIVPTGANTASADSIKAARDDWDTAVRALGPQETSRSMETRVIAGNPKLSFIQHRDLVGKPHADEEMQKVSVTTEAGLMADLLQKLVPKSRDAAREQRLPIWKEEKARNTVQNVIYLLNMLDEKYGLWKGDVAVLSSNDGHLDRGVAVLEAFGIPADHIVPIAAEPVLGAYGYGAQTRDENGLNFLDRLTAEEQKTERLLGQGKWLEMIKRVPAYMLPELTKLTSGQRLRTVIGALQEWYKQSDVDMVSMYPQLAPYETMDIGQLRDALKNIPRDTTTGPWERYIDYDGMREKIAQNATDTLAWIVKRE